MTPPLLNLIQSRLASPAGILLVTLIAFAAEEETTHLNPDVPVGTASIPVSAASVSLWPRDHPETAFGVDLSTATTSAVSPLPLVAVCATPKVAHEKTGVKKILNQLTGMQDPYFVPADAFSTEQKALDFVLATKPRMPLFEPFDNQVVKPVQGWYYKQGNFHAGLDFMRKPMDSGEDPSFPVYAVASGKVLSAYWDNGRGNTVIIEHTAPDGQQYRSVYLHLRNGFTHDLQKARAIVVPKDADPADLNNPNWKVARYSLYAHAASPKTLFWGTEQHTLKVKPNDYVTAGQLIGYAGNTGAGGASAGLKADGTLSDSLRANVHLHLAFAVRRPPLSADDWTPAWVFLDPYGVYNELDPLDAYPSESAGCYELGKTTAYPRLFAPFYPAFHNIPLNILSQYFHYYPDVGYGLQTVSVHQGDQGVYASGSFHSTLPKWKAQIYVTPSEMSAFVSTYRMLGYRPREVSALALPTAAPRFTAIWKEVTSELFDVDFALTDVAFEQKRQQLVEGQGYRIDDHFIYRHLGQRFHAVVFVKDGLTDWKNPTGFTSSAYESYVQTLYDQGYRQTSVNVEDLPLSNAIGGIFMRKPGSWPVHWGLSPTQYQTQFLVYAAQGYRLMKVQGYENSTKFAAIWCK
jgi:murein DD-endopeptidase MepM/ murein hydrolase activator NlpD